MREHFEKWLENTEKKTKQTAYNYALAINRISNHYSNKKSQKLNLYSVLELSKLEEVIALYGTQGIYSDFGNMGNGTNRAAINSLYRFRQNTQNINFTELDDVENNEANESENSTNFSYERDLKNAIIYQIDELFPNYQIFGEENKGIEYLIGGKRIDILLEKSNGDLLAVELKSGKAKFNVFGQISMYLGLLKDAFPEREIKGCIIAGEIDDSLKKANKTTEKVTLMSYTMKLNIITE